MHDGPQQVSFTRDHRHLFFGHHVARQRQNDVVDARVHEVLEKDLLAALQFVNTWIVRQVVSDSLIPVSEVGGPERGVHYLHWSLQATFRGPVPLSKG